jgi:hypothetical protein
MWMILLAVLLLVLGLLAVPLGLDYRLNWRGRLQGEIHLIWLFGLLRLRIPTDSTPAAADQKTAAKPKRRRQPSGRKSRSSPLAAWRLRPFRQRIFRFVRDLWRAVHKHDLRLRLRIGLDDPADTGQLWALMGPLSAIAANSQAAEVSIEPDFMQSTLELHSSGRIRLVPLQLLGLALGLLLSPAFWQGMRQMKKAA